MAKGEKMDFKKLTWLDLSLVILSIFSFVLGIAFSTLQYAQKGLLRRIFWAFPPDMAYGGWLGC